MARTRPRGAPLRTATREGSFLNPITIPDSRSPTPEAQPERDLSYTTTQETPTGTSQRVLRSSTNHSNSNTSEHRVHGDGVAKAAAKPKAMNIPIAKECAICATTRPVVNSGGRGFRPLEAMCDHFKEICNHCITALVQVKIETLDLNEALLACPFPDCDCRLGYYDLEKLMKKASFQSWDLALLKHCMRVSKNYMSCLNVECNRSFSIEDCQIQNKNTGAFTVGKNIACPYCDRKMCLNCMSPVHDGRSCEDPDKHSELNAQAMEAIGAKPCPACGTQIQKNGGCNHMRCSSCTAHFCFGCLAFYTDTIQHAPGCIENTGILGDLRNYIGARAGPLNDAANAQPRANPDAQLPNAPERPGIRRINVLDDDFLLLLRRREPGPLHPQNIPWFPPLPGHGLQPRDVDGPDNAPHGDAAPQPVEPPARVHRPRVFRPHRFVPGARPAPNPPLMTQEEARQIHEAANNHRQQAGNGSIPHGRNPNPPIQPVWRPPQRTRGAIARALEMNSLANGGNGPDENDILNGNRGMFDGEDTGGIFMRTRSHFQRARPRGPTTLNGSRFDDRTGGNPNI